MLNSIRHAALLTDTKSTLFSILSAVATLAIWSPTMVFQCAMTSYSRSFRVIPRSRARLSSADLSSNGCFFDVIECNPFAGSFFHNEPSVPGTPGKSIPEKGTIRRGHDGLSKVRDTMQKPLCTLSVQLAENVVEEKHRRFLPLLLQVDELRHLQRDEECLVLSLGG